MRVPRRAAVALAALALTGTVAGCGGDDDQPADDAPAVEEPALTDPDQVTDPDVPVAPGEEDVPEEIAPTP